MKYSINKKQMVLWGGYILSVLFILLSEIISLYFGSEIIHQSIFDLFENFIFFIGYILIIFFSIFFILNKTRLISLTSLALYIFFIPSSVGGFHDLVDLLQMGYKYFSFGILSWCGAALAIFQPLSFIIWLILNFYHRSDYIKTIKSFKNKLLNE